MMTFSVGPSKVYPKVKEYLQDAYDTGILTINHRSEVFMQIMQKINLLFESKLHKPHDYTVLLSSSATECWEIVAQSLTKKGSYHFYSGAFGERWYQRAHHINPNSRGWKFYFQKPFERVQLDNYVNAITDKVKPIDTTLCFTQNETSNGTHLDMPILRKFRQAYPESVIAIDATSSMGGIALEWDCADFWYASVQKCFGLPAGLAVMVLSPKAIERMQIIAEEGRYNSLNNIYRNALKYQTTHTPNVLGIYLLSRMLEDSQPIHVTNGHIRQRADDLYTFFEQQEIFVPLITNPALRSNTVITLESFESEIQKVKAKALSAGIELGKGYGTLNDNTIRLANFPAISDEEIRKLKEFFLVQSS